MTTIAITGASGFIGSHLARALPDAVLFDYPAKNLCRLEDAYNFIEGNRPDIVYHLAAQSVVTNTDERQSYDVNVTGTLNLLHACNVVGCVKSFVHISTDKVYGTNANARRSDPLRGIGEPYAASKHCGDIIAQQYKAFHGLPIHIIRTGNIYGPGDPHLDRIIPGTITDALAGRTRHHRGDPRFIRDYIYIDDLIPAYLRIADEPPGIFNLGGEFYSVRDVVEMIRRLIGGPAPVWDNSQHNEIPFQHVVDCPDWWKPQTSLEEGLTKTIAWYMKNLEKEEEDANQFFPVT